MSNLRSLVLDACRDPESTINIVGTLTAATCLESLVVAAEFKNYVPFTEVIAHSCPRLYHLGYCHVDDDENEIFGSVSDVYKVHGMTHA